MGKDHLTKEQRSSCMSKIRSKWTGPEKKIHNFLIRKKIRHRMHPKMQGSPDLILPEKKVAVFLHGCFWHGCKRCYRKPVHNARFWKTKIENNMKRDKGGLAELKKRGWHTLVLWEHEINDSLEQCYLKLSRFRQTHRSSCRSPRGRHHPVPLDR